MIFWLSRIETSWWATSSQSGYSFYTHSEAIFKFVCMRTTKLEPRFSGFSFWFWLEHQVFEHRHGLWGWDCQITNAMRERGSFTQRRILCEVHTKHIYMYGPSMAMTIVSGGDNVMTGMYIIILHRVNTVEPRRGWEPRGHEKVSALVRCLG